jgi:hypothetical protein
MKKQNAHSAQEPIMTLNLDRTEHKTLVHYLLDHVIDHTVGAEVDECFDCLVSKFGERYGFETLDSELENLILGVIEDVKRIWEQEASGDYTGWAKTATTEYEYQQPTAERHDADYWLSAEERELAPFPGKGGSGDGPIDWSWSDAEDGWDDSITREMRGSGE